MKIILVMSRDPNDVIGIDNILAIKDKKDMAFFKSLTSGEKKAVLMGNNTYISIGSKPLPNRYNIVITSKKAESKENLFVVDSIEEAISVAKSLNIEQLFVIGGKSIYQQMNSLVDEMYITNFNQYVLPSEENVVCTLDYSQFSKETVIMSNEDFTLIHYSKGN